MNNRLLDLVKYKTGGKQKAFAELMGWSPQYLTKLLRGENFGLQPVLTLLENLPEVNARWLLLAQGSMLNSDGISALRLAAVSRVQALLYYERFLPVMTAEEVGRFEKMIKDNEIPGFSPDDVVRWNTLLDERSSSLDDFICDAIEKSIIPCKHLTPKK